MKKTTAIRSTAMMFYVAGLLATMTLLQVPHGLAQTTFKSSAEKRLRRIEEHQQIRRAALELTQDLRGIHLTPEQRQEIRQLLKRYHTSTGTSRRNQNPPAESATEPTSENSGSPATRPPTAERLRSEIVTLLTSEQSDRLNAIKQEREERAQKNPDFQIRKKP